MSKNIALSGDLQFISQADIFQILGGNNSRYKERFSIVRLSWWTYQTK
jgi:hypothetical protein